MHHWISSVEVRPHHVLVRSLCCKDSHIFSPESRKNSFQAGSQHIGNPLLLRLSWCLSASQQVTAASHPPPTPRLSTPPIPKPSSQTFFFFFLSCVSAQPQGPQVIHPLSHASKHTYLHFFFFFTHTHTQHCFSCTIQRDISNNNAHCRSIKSIPDFQKKRFFLTWIKLFFLCALVCRWSLCRPSGGHLDWRR